MWIVDPFHLAAVGEPRIPGFESGYCHMLFPWHSFSILLSVDVRFPFFPLVVYVFLSLVSLFEILFGQPFIQVVWRVAISG
jgi:hypothetical protein